MGKRIKCHGRTIVLGEFQQNVIQELPERRCEECGQLDECRPYGRDGKWICFECGMKDEATTNRNMNAKLFGEPQA